MISHRRILATVAVATATVIVAACGSDSDTGSTGGALADGDRIDVEMSNLAFDPSEFTVAQGATVTFVFDNTDTIDHEALIGGEAAQDEHETEMMESGGDMSDGGSGDDTTSTTEGEMSHKSGAADPSESVAVAPGESAEITYTFDEPGTVLLGCHEPGHYDGGMRATITVT